MTGDEQSLTMDLDSVRAARDLAARLAELLTGGEVLALHGDLGAGKTTFVQGLARGLGLGPDEPVTSPTFVLAVNYPDLRLELIHVDLYRLDPDEAVELGLDEILSGPEPDRPVTAVEWAERATDLLPDDRLDINLSWTGPESRRIVIRALGPCSATIVGQLKRHF